MFQSLAQGGIIGCQYLYLPWIDSTNSYCQRLLDEVPRPAEGTIIRAGYQQAGRGQRGNEWVAEADSNLTFSCILYPAFIEPVQQFILNIAVSLSLAELLEEYTDNVLVKWPNDIYVNEKKIAGILIENSIQGFTLQWCVVGIGLNINQLQFGEHRATSLALLTGRQYDNTALLTAWCSVFENYYRMLKTNGAKAMEKAYFARLWGFNQTVKYYKNNTLLSGIIRGVNSVGQLVMEEENATVYYNFKEISFVI